jgi:hypothetical protein
MDKLPVIAFLDLDKTVIAKPHAQVEHLFLRKIVQELGDAGEIPARLLAQLPEPPLPEDEIGPLLRPGFADAVRRINAALGPNVEWFVCTMGFPITVSELKLPGIERATGLRMNRPVFDQPACRAAVDDGSKLVWQCFQKAIVSLQRKKKYAPVREQLRDPKVVLDVFTQRFFMVDDTPNVAFDSASNMRLITCPPYEHEAPSTAATMPDSILRLPKVRDYLKRRPLPPPGGPGPTARAPDTFWQDLASIAERQRTVNGMLREWKDLSGRGGGGGRT